VSKFIFSLVILLLFNAGAAATQPQWMLLNANTGEILSLRDDGTPKPIASITKLMSALVILRSGIAVNEIVPVTGGVHSKNLYGGMQTSRMNLITLALVSSDNLAAKTLADTWPGGYNDFINSMNKTASEIGMANTQYGDSTGILSSNSSTLDDLRKLVMASRDLPPFRMAANASNIILEVQQRTQRGFVLRRIEGRNTNPYVGKLDIILAKTGYTSRAGRCLTMLFNYRGGTYLLIVLGARDQRHRSELVDRLIDLIN
jgi:D-alanyl-D-alanine endopeptidase (penicillin-binding protein 7)